MKEPMMRGRFAPSPTGEMHLGNAWAALLAWLQVRASGGRMVLRIEDLDPDRSREAYIAGVVRDLAWLGLDWDEGEARGGLYGPYRQSARRSLYQAALGQLAATDGVYPCYCTRAELAASAPHAEDGERCYPGTCAQGVAPERQQGRQPALRLRVEPAVISFVDGVYGRIEQNVAASIGDFVVRRSDGVHAYQLAVVVDDAAMQITDVLRGDDLLYSTPRQLLLYQRLGLTAPRFSHVPLLMDREGRRLSKRHGALSLAALRERGISAAAVIGYLAYWANLQTEPLPQNAAALVARFALERLPKQPIIISEQDFFR